MTISKILQDDIVTLSLAGRLDTVTCIDLTNEIDKIFAEAPYNLTLDFSNLEYISSAGLRVVFSAQKLVDSHGKKLVIIGTNDNIKDTFNITGFSTILDIS